LIHRLTNSTEFPVLLVGGQTVGFPPTTGNAADPSGIAGESMTAKSVFERIKELHDSGELGEQIQSAGGVIGGGKKKKGKRN
jgi:hypothetical protein